MGPVTSGPAPARRAPGRLHRHGEGALTGAGCPVAEPHRQVLKPNRRAQRRRIEVRSD
jgi:hypothetical protein